MAITAEPPTGKLDDLQKLVALCKRRGFIFASAEIYGGFANTYDYGPLGALLKNNVRDAWLRTNVQRRDDIELLDAALITSWRLADPGTLTQLAACRTGGHSPNRCLDWCCGRSGDPGIVFESDSN